VGPDTKVRTGQHEAAEPGAEEGAAAGDAGVKDSVRDRREHPLVHTVGRSAGG